MSLNRLYDNRYVTIAMKKTLLSQFIFISLLVTTSLVQAQTQADKAFIIQQTNVKALQKIAEKSTKYYQTNLRRSKVDTIQISNVNGQLQIGYLSGFDEKGNPVYDYEDNEITAITGRVNKIWSDDINFYRLDGKNIEIGHWEAGGLALITHQELDGRITYAEPSETTGHATHTAGTILGKGVDKEGRGMASRATIISRRSDNDEAELALFASQGGILSNHSYRTGDPLGDIPEYGKYTANSAEWDEILYKAPFLLASKSAGNNRNDDVNEKDGGYDVLFTIALSKNLVTVGACKGVLKYDGPSSVQSAIFSSWGPTDDWRIKPDIVTNGVEVYSANNRNAESYSFRSGTSMSAAGMTGAIALLQQLHYKLNDAYMKSATVKALLVATTDEAGAYDGPDFQNGWGLLNAERAAKTLLNNGIGSRVEELSLINGTTFTTDIETDGILPLSLAMAWTDPPGEPQTELDDLTPVLVNDLDVRIKGGDGITYYPWTMTPNDSANNFTDAATKGDNFRDNVERIDIANLPAGKYTVVVTHKETLGKARQDFSLVIQGLLDNVVGIEDDLDNGIFEVYPNPSNGNLQVLIPEQLHAKQYSLKVYTTSGVLVEDAQYNEPLIGLDLSHLSVGTYILGLQTEKGFYKKMIVIE